MIKIFTQKSTRSKGSEAEDLASKYLKKLGYKIIARNFLIRGGEIDIIAKEDNVLVFVEVKARFNHNFGLPKESITYFKQASLQKTAQFYIEKIKWGDLPYRFDLIAIDYTKPDKNPQIELIKNIIEG